MIEYKKLVRDKIPDIIEAEGKTPTTHIAGDAEYGAALVDKLSEEVGEFKASGKAEELADILEVIDAICVFRSIDRESLQQVKQEKAQERGTFDGRVMLDRVE